NNLAVRLRAFFPLAREQPGAVSGTIEPHINVARPRDFDRGHSVDRADLGDQLLSDLFRRLPELFRELERYRDRQFAKLRLLRLLDHHLRLDAISHGYM